MGGVYVPRSPTTGVPPLACVQEQCGFEDGELRAVMVESQPLLGSSLHWRIHDAKRGKLAEGHASLDELARRAPWDYGEFTRRPG